MRNYGKKHLAMCTNTHTIFQYDNYQRKKSIKIKYFFLIFNHEKKGEKNHKHPMSDTVFLTFGCVRNSHGAWYSVLDRYAGQFLSFGPVLSTPGSGILGNKSLPDHWALQRTSPIATAHLHTMLKIHAFQMTAD